MDLVHNLILKNHEKLDSVFKYCELHYTIIKMKVDRNNIIIFQTSLNAISENFLRLFKPLEKMNFPREE